MSTPEEQAEIVLATYPLEFRAIDVVEDNRAELVQAIYNDGPLAAWQIAHNLLTVEYPCYLRQMGMPDVERWNKIAQANQNLEIIQAQMQLCQHAMQLQHQNHAATLEAFTQDRQHERSAWLATVDRQQKLTEMAIEAANEAMRYANANQQQTTPVYIHNHVEAHGGRGGQGGSSSSEGGGYAAPEGAIVLWGIAVLLVASVALATDRGIQPPPPPPPPPVHAPVLPT